MALTPADPAPPTADEALHRLIDGNDRFMRGEARFPAAARQPALAKLVQGQRPYATILGCSDSRVPPELLFDAGFGDLFVIRVAGNVLSAEVAGSMQYAGAHLQTPLFVVLGHEGCGAVSAAMETKSHDARHRSRIQILIDQIVPGLPEPDPRLSPVAQWARAIEANVRWTVHQILHTPEAQARQAEGRFKLVGAVCDLEDGRVRFLAT